MKLESEDIKLISTTAIIISIIIHILIYFTVFTLDSLYPELLSKLGLKQNIIDVPPKSEPYIIADIMPPAVQVRPDKADFMGEYDSSVPEQMIAQKFGKGEKVGSGEKAKKAKEPKENKEKVVRKPDKKDDLFAYGNIYKPKKQIESDGIEYQKGVEGDALPEDYYPDYRRGPHTYLNVLRYPNVSYFVMMKRKFKMTFNPGPALNQYFVMNRIVRGSVDVVLGVTLDSAGKLIELFVFRESGIPEYDQESMRTVRSSAPFSTPPKDFLEDGVLRMSWTFTTYL